MPSKNKVTIYVFGNPDIKSDSVAIDIAKKLPEYNFKFIKPNEDVTFDSNNPVILDVVEGINKVAVFNNINDVKKFKSTTVHDFDLGFQLKYLKKLGKINNVTIIGLPRHTKVSVSILERTIRQLTALITTI